MTKQPPNTNHKNPLDRLLAIMVTLRDPITGCAWDKKQDFASIAPYTIEEAYEVIDAIQREDMTDLKSELGDLLLQIVFHARIAEESALFNFDDVATAIADKMERRHPHIFADAAADTQTDTSWEDIKASERRARAAAQSGTRPPSLLDDVPLALPALSRAVKLQKRAARIGFDWQHIAPIMTKLQEEIAEFQAELDAEHPDKNRLLDELGDILFVIANMGRHIKADPEQAIRHTNAKFERRFRWMEQNCANLEALSLDAMEELWQMAKNETG